MKKLFGVQSHFKEDTHVKRDYVYYVETEEDAKNEFLKDWNYRTYQEIECVNEITDKKCDIDYQLGRECHGMDEYNFQFNETKNGFEIVVNNVLNFGTIVFKPQYCHSLGNRLDFMICLDGGRPNWLY